MHVYFLKADFESAGLFYKVGVADDVEARLDALQTGCPLPILIVASMRCASRGQAFEIERQLHDLYRERCTCGEWFHLRPGEEMAIRHLMDSWPIAGPFEDFMRAARRVGNQNAFRADLPRVTGKLIDQRDHDGAVPFAALAAARAKIKELKARVAQLEAERGPCNSASGR